MQIYKRETELWAKEDKLPLVNQKVYTQKQNIKRGVHSYARSSEVASKKTPSFNAASKYGWKSKGAKETAETIKNVSDKAAQKTLDSVTTVAASSNAITGTIETTKKVKEVAQRLFDIAKKRNEQVDEQEKKTVSGIAMAGILICLLLMVTPVLSSVAGLQIGLAKEPIVNQITTVAEIEAMNSESNIGGDKYKDWYGMNADWCAMFVSWCGNECGYIEDGIMPRSCSVANMRLWYQDIERYIEADTGYVPEAGDIIFFENGMSHVGLVVGYDAQNHIVITVEGNTGQSDTTPYHLGSCVKKRYYPLTYRKISGYAKPLYPKYYISIPWPLGKEYSYLSFNENVDENFEVNYSDEISFDEDGFAVCNKRYVVAVTSAIGSPGDYINFELYDGTVIPTIVGGTVDMWQSGHSIYGKDLGSTVIQFLVDDSWGGDMNPVTFHPEWDERVVKAVHVGFSLE